uniref:hypothetical protein n=1 Tax=uncultured Bacteroides sp. TaxID=162156 RepID=UPI00259BD550|nr:hypothetical protein [uncultured Bacteroides sp.]
MTRVIGQAERGRPKNKKRKDWKHRMQRAGKLTPVKTERMRIILPRVFFVFRHESLVSANSGILMLEHEK